jgi:hydroxymethylbilane synthase
VCRQADTDCATACAGLNDSETALCTAIERDFLRALMGGCSTPISALAKVVDHEVVFEGNIASPDGTQMTGIKLSAPVNSASGLGVEAAATIMETGGKSIIALFKNEK